MPAFDIEPFVGPCFVIIWLSFILYGLFLAQIYNYFTTYEDHIIIKLAVTLLCILETLQVAACIHVTYTNLIIDFAQPEKLLYVLWSDIFAISIELVINGLVQSYYVFRVWRLSKNVPILVVLCLILCARTALGFKAIADSNAHRLWFELAVLKEYEIFVEVTLSLSLLLDSSITVILLFYLSRAQTLALRPNTKTTLHKLMYYALSTGGVTTLTTVVTLIVFKTSKFPIVYGGLVTLMAKVYANSMLAMLNLRQGLRIGNASNDAYIAQLSDLSDLSRRVESRPDGRIHVIQERILNDDSWPESSTKKMSENTSTNIV
ncbi:hypothetical protein BDY19DRAFT_162739 [Irpex rosettiformis]|uniref:Uncharacterized protein n=1 Tax=Irpex rosettiformis TaxID=378272 RepID=A0ACB8U412_9APHY|nr:hypothetical protein BDY19DRAFT_162739 [Irpex rosettiformis]